MVKLICLLGVIGSGKTYRAEKLVKEEGFIHINFADELREISWEILKWRPKNEQEYEDFKNGLIYISSMDGRVNGRQFLQNLGMSIRKRYPNFFTECWRAKAIHILETDTSVVCSDLRFINELEYVLDIQCSNINYCSLNKEFIFCDYRSNRYKANDNHESERLAQGILIDGYKDGDRLYYNYFKNYKKERRLNKMARVLISLPEVLLKKIDEIVKKDYGIRSEFIRQACREFIARYKKES